RFPPSPFNTRGCVGAAFLQNARRENARGFDIGWIIQQHERLLGNVRAVAFSSAFFPAGSVEGDETGVKKRPLPPNIKATAILALAFVGLVGARWKIQVLPITLRLIRLDARAANFGDEQTGDA